MIKNIHVLKFLIIFNIGSIYTEFTLTRDRSNGPYSQDFMKKIFEEHPDETIIFQYTYEKGLLSRFAGLLQGDFSLVFSCSGWVLKKAWSYVAIPSVITYCFTGYIIYRAYKIIEYFDSFFPSLPKQKKSESQDVLVGDIDRLLYKNISRSRKFRHAITGQEILKEKRHLYHILQQYRAFSHSLELTGMRNLFWYDTEYEKKISDLITLLEYSFSLPNS